MNADRFHFVTFVVAKLEALIQISARLVQPRGAVGQTEMNGDGQLLVFVDARLHRLRVVRKTGVKIARLVRRTRRELGVLAAEFSDLLGGELRLFPSFR